MKRLKVLVLLPLLLLTGCKTLSTKDTPSLSNYDKVHIQELGCVSTLNCELIAIRSDSPSEDGTVGNLAIKYKDGMSNEFITTSFALVKGRCPICKK